MRNAGGLRRLGRGVRPGVGREGVEVGEEGAVVAEARIRWQIILILLVMWVLVDKAQREDGE